MLIAATVAQGAWQSNGLPGRRSPEDIVFYKSVGSALQDVVTAEMLLRRARETNHFTLMPAGVVTITR